MATGDNDTKERADRKRSGKDGQLLIRISKEERAAFVTLCERLDTTAAREIRRFIREFTAAHGGAVGTSPKVVRSTADREDEARGP
jgi:hypothetical protein